MSCPRAVVLTALLTLVVQGFLQATFFPWSALAGDARLNNIDAPFHLYQMELARGLCAERLVVGYDPYFAAGYLGGVTFNASAKLPALLHCAGSAYTSAEAILKAVSFWSGVLAPVLIVFACWMLRIGVAATTVAAALALVLWWTGPMRWYHTAGMVSFVFVAFAVPAYVAAFLRVTERLSALRVGALALAAAAGALVHPLFVVAVVLLGVPVLIFDSRWPRAGFIRVAWALWIGLVVLALSWVWLGPSLSAPGFSSIAAPYQREVDPLLFVREMTMSAPTAAGGSLVFSGLLLAALAGLAWAPEPSRRTLIGFGAGAAVLMAWASVGALVEPIATLQPNRFSALAWLVLSIPAAVGLVLVMERVWHGRGIERWVAGSIGLVSLAPVAYGGHEMFGEALGDAGRPRYGVQPPEVRGAGGVEAATLRFMLESTDPSARVLFENSLGRVHDGGHIAGVLALQSGRELIGGPYPFAGMASAWDGVAFGRELSTLSPRELTTWLDLYNVRWMLCHSQACRVAMGRLADTDPVAEWGPVKAFARTASPGFVAEGKGHVVARCANRVEFEGVQGDRLTLRYQWIPGLRAVPAGRVQPVKLHPDAPPFVSVIDAPERFALRWGPGNGIACGLRERGTP